jgi:hypothetical protein
MHHFINPLLGLFVAGPVGGLLGLLYFVFWIWMLIDAIQNPRFVGNERIVWVLVIIFLPCIGSILYFFIGRGK